MKTNNRTDLSYLSGVSAHERAKEIRQAILTMAYRWRCVSDATIAEVLKYEYGINRPRYGAQLARSGFFTTHKVRPGYFVEGARQVYSLSREGCVELIRLGMIDATCEQAKPAWSTMQHSLDLQRIAAKLDTTNITSFQWATEVETRERFDRKAIVPDLVYETQSEYGFYTVAIWVELERSPKNDLRLTHLVNRYATLFDRQNEHGERSIYTGTHNGIELELVHILVMTDYQKGRYQAWFNTEDLKKTSIDGQGRIQYENRTINAKSMIGGRVKVDTIKEFNERHSI